MRQLRIKPIPDYEEYFKAFDLQTCLNAIRVFPKTWGIKKIADDDKWGVKLQLETGLVSDPYFILAGFLLHPFLKGSLFSDSGFADCYTQMMLIDKTEMGVYNEKAEDVKKELKAGITEGYDEKSHFLTLKALTYISRDAFNFLDEHSYAIKSIRHIDFYMNSNITYYCTESMASKYTTYAKKALLELIQHRFIEQCSICLYDQHTPAKSILSFHTPQQVDELVEKQLLVF
jgi:hypothetical protein